MSTLLTASILLLLLWPAYALLLRYSERYALNRLLLAAAMAAVVALPFVSFDSPAPRVTESLQGTVEYVERSSYQLLALVPEDRAVYVSSDPEKPYGNPANATIKAQTIPVVYMIGIGLMLALLGGRMLFLLSLHLRSRLNGRAGYRVLHAGSAPGQAFTFGTNIYFSEDVPADPDFDHILTHERVHARQLHTLDILLSELFLCFFWFHPAAWWLRTKMRANLEYLVDKAVVNQGADRRNYQLALVRQSIAAQGLALSLPFSEPSLKSRIARLTGLPEYRVIGILAAVALTFWLGVAILVVNGKPSDTNPADKSTFFGTVSIDELGNALAEENNVEFQEFWESYRQADVAGIKSFELYLRRLPTPYEYAQIRQMLGALDHTRFTIFQPCNDEEGAYALQLTHWLNTEARLPFYLMDDELLDHHYVFKLEANGFGNAVPTEPHVTAGYFTPRVLPTVLDENEPFAWHTRSGHDVYSADTAKDTDAKNLRPIEARLMDYRADIADEHIAVFINGERRPLKRRPPVTVHGEGSEDVISVSINGRPVPTWSQSYFADWKNVIAANGAPPRPANVRMNCLLGYGSGSFNITRHVRSGRTGSNRDWFERLNLPPGREVVYYLNDEVSTATTVLDQAFEYADVQVGYDRNVSNGPIIVQVVTEMNWFVTRVE